MRDLKKAFHYRYSQTAPDMVVPEDDVDLIAVVSSDPSAPESEKACMYFPP